MHLVVWTKFALEDDPETGHTRDDVKSEIETWVDRVFGEKCGRENVSTIFFSFSFILFLFLLYYDIYVCQYAGEISVLLARARDSSH